VEIRNPLGTVLFAPAHASCMWLWTRHLRPLSCSQPVSETTAHCVPVLLHQASHQQYRQQRDAHRVLREVSRIRRICGLLQTQAATTFLAWPTGLHVLSETRQRSSHASHCQHGTSGKLKPRHAPQANPDITRVSSRKMCRRGIGIGPGHAPLHSNDLAFAVYVLSLGTVRKQRLNPRHT